MLYPKVMALRWLLVWLMILLVVDAPVGFAQEPAGRKRPKIGLALSGGGARGIAHIGVLKWFDEHRIPVDYIAGTSMGGLVGGMYTMGLKPNEMRQLLSDINWNALLRGTPDYQELSFRRKEDRRQFQTDLELRFAHRVTGAQRTESGASNRPDSGADHPALRYHQQFR
jgi:NTE family protein